MSRPLRIAIVNDYEIVVRGLRAMLEPFGDRVHVVEIEAGGLPEEDVDIVLFDTFASRRESLTRVEEIAADGRSDHLVLYTWDAPAAYLREIDETHVDGVVLKSQRGERLVEALEKIVAGVPIGADLLSDDGGEPALTEREREVLALIARGRTNPEIASDLYLSVDTVKTHVRTLFRKLDVNNRTQAALAAHNYELDDPRTRLAG